MNSLRDVVQAALASAEVARNSRGQVRAALCVLPRSLQNLLACDFAEHGVLQLGDIGNEKVRAAVDAIQAIRGFLNGDLAIQEVDRLRRRFEFLDTTVIRHNRGGARTSGTFASIVCLAARCCCQRELERALLAFRNRYQPDAVAVASQICVAMARNTGGADWDAEDRQRRQAARRLGRSASKREAEWQISQIVAKVDST